MEILTLYSQYIYSLVLYTINNKHRFDTNNEIHEYKTRNNNNLYRPIANLSKFNNKAYISGIEVFNHLPQYIKALTKTKLNSVALVRERTIPTERPPPVGEVSANFCG